jgi:hypothetical protein
MLFVLATPEYNNLQANTTRVKVHLKNGVAEIFDQHQDLMGRVENNIVEIETNFENKVEKFLYALQDAVFVVSNKGLDGEYKGTCVYVYAKKAAELGSNFSLDDLTKQYDQKKLKLESELEKLIGKESSSEGKVISSRILLIKEDVEFLRKALLLGKGTK